MIVKYDIVDGGYFSPPKYKFQIKINNIKEFGLLNSYFLSLGWYWVPNIDSLKDEKSYNKSVYVIIDNKMKYLSFTYQNYNYNRYFPYILWQRKNKIKKII